MIKKNKEKRKKKVSTVAASVVTKSIVIRIRKNEIEKKNLQVFVYTGLVYVLKEKKTKNKLNP